MTETDKPFCASSPEAQALSGAEFWDAVYSQHQRPYEPEEPDEIELLEMGYVNRLDIAPPCPECGGHGACAYDDEGRPLIHAVKDHDEDS